MSCLIVEQWVAVITALVAFNGAVFLFPAFLTFGNQAWLAT
jgi:hypothetical protein